MDCSTPGLPVRHQLLEFTQTHVHWGEGNGNPLQYSRLEKPRDGGAWWTAVYGVAQSRTWLKRLGSSSSMSIESVMPSNHLILCRTLLSPSIFPSIRVFSNESALRIKWPKYWSFSFSLKFLICRPCLNAAFSKLPSQIRQMWIPLAYLFPSPRSSDFSILPLPLCFSELFIVCELLKDRTPCLSCSPLYSQGLGQYLAQRRHWLYTYRINGWNRQMGSQIHNGALGRAPVFEELGVCSIFCTLKEDVEWQKKKNKQTYFLKRFGFISQHYDLLVLWIWAVYPTFLKFNIWISIAINDNYFIGFL